MFTKHYAAFYTLKRSILYISKLSLEIDVNKTYIITSTKKPKHVLFYNLHTLFFRKQGNLKLTSWMMARTH